MQKTCPFEEVIMIYFIQKAYMILATCYYWVHIEVYCPQVHETATHCVQFRRSMTSKSILPTHSSYVDKELKEYHFESVVETDLFNS